MGTVLMCQWWGLSSWHRGFLSVKDTRSAWLVKNRSERREIWFLLLDLTFWGNYVVGLWCEEASPQGLCVPFPFKFLHSLVQLSSLFSHCFVVLVTETCSLHCNKGCLNWPDFRAVGLQTKLHCCMFRKCKAVPQAGVMGQSQTSKQSIWVSAKLVYPSVYRKVEDSVECSHVMKEMHLSTLVFHLRWSVGSQ